jgi:uridine phosphorylase
MNKISETDLIINPDGTIYHLNLLPEDIAETVITVGDPDRVSEVSKHFDIIELKKGKREFISHTGYLGSRRITVISTGIGTDNIDIVLNELDALVNIDFSSRMVKPELKSLNIIRIGTSGAVQQDIPLGSIIVSEYGIGLDSIMQYYLSQISAEEHMMLDAFKTHFHHLKGISPYISAADPDLIASIGIGLERGITVTAPGFYAPQGRQVRAKASFPDLIDDIQSFRYTNYRITNLEMETAGIYAISKVLGHKALSVNAILASRLNFDFSPNPEKVINQTIELVLSRL